MDQAQTSHYLQVAASLRPRLSRKTFRPVSVIKPAPDAKAFQGWAAKVVGPAGEAFGKEMNSGSSVTLDFGQHLAGYLKFSIAPVRPIMGAPVRLKFIFAETLSELAEPLDPSPSWLCRSWIQDEIVNVDWLPAEVSLPRRYAFRYVKVTVLAADSPVKFGQMACSAVSSAGFGKSTLPKSLAGHKEMRDIFDVSVRTLRNCMQLVFEDGPKRDRRLWLGDLRIQALCNYQTFRNYDLVKRCLYLFAGLPMDDGLLAACIYDQPSPVCGRNLLLDYAALFAPTLLDYATAGGDWAAAEDLWPVVRRQDELLSGYVDDRGLWDISKSTRIFTDWKPELNKHAAMQAVMIYSSKATLELARKLNKLADVPRVEERIGKMVTAAREQMFDESAGLFVSGPDRQISYASNAWMVLAEAAFEQEAAGILKRLMQRADAVRPTTPYLYHHLAEALLIAGLRDEATKLIRDYWGAMVALGASTFWEFFDPVDHRFSAYKDHHINSYCHAWSCSPAYLIPKYL